MIAAQKLQKMERLNRGRKRFNAFIGFKKLEDPRTRLLAESDPDQGCSYENVCSTTVLPYSLYGVDRRRQIILVRFSV